MTLHRELIALLFTILLVPSNAARNPITDCAQCKATDTDNVLLASIGQTTYIESPSNLATCHAATCIWTITGPEGSVLRLRFLSYQMQELDSVTAFNHTGLDGSPILHCSSFESSCSQSWMTTTGNVLTFVLDHQGQAYSSVNISVTAVKPFLCGASDVTLRHTGLTVLSSPGYPYTFCPQSSSCTYDIQSLTASSFVFVHAQSIYGNSTLLQYNIINENAVLIQECSDQNNCGDRTTVGTKMRITFKCQVDQTKSPLQHNEKGIQIYLDDRHTPTPGTQHCGQPEYPTHIIAPGKSKIMNSAGYPDEYCGHNKNLYRFTTEKEYHLQFSTIGVTGNLQTVAYNDLNADDKSEVSTICGGSGNILGISRSNEMSVRMSNHGSRPVQKFQFNITAVRNCPELVTHNISGSFGCDQWMPVSYGCSQGEYSYANCKTLYTGKQAGSAITWEATICQLDLDTVVNVYDGQNMDTGKLIGTFNHTYCPQSGDKLKAVSGSMLIQYTTQKAQATSSQDLNALICF